MASNVESPTQFEPARIDALTGGLPDLIAEIAAKAEVLGRALRPQTALCRASLVLLMMKAYCSNLMHSALGYRARARRRTR